MVSTSQGRRTHNLSEFGGIRQNFHSENFDESINYKIAGNLAVCWDISINSPSKEELIFS